MRKTKCLDRIKIDGNWECKHRRKLIAGLDGCLCREDNCYRLKKSK